MDGLAVGNARFMTGVMLVGLVPIQNMRHICDNTRILFLFFVLTLVPAIYALNFFSPLNRPDRCFPLPFPTED